VRKVKNLVNTFILFLLFVQSADCIEVVDDIGRALQLENPAQRIVSLAPHITENIFAAGAGDLIIGVVSYSDFPLPAKSIPLVGTYNNFNIEAIVAAQPDLVIAWKEGNQRQQVEKLIALGINVYINDSTTLEDIAQNIRHFGILAGTNETAQKASEIFLARLQSLRIKYSNLKKVRVFYQTWNTPLITVNKTQSIGQIIQLCSGDNIFGQLAARSPQVNVEAVLASNPETIIASGMNESRPDWLDDWKKWSFLNAVDKDYLFFVPPDLIQRYSPRILDGAEMICEYLQQVRDA